MLQMSLMPTTISRSNVQNQIFNVGSGQTISVNKIVELLECDKVYIPKRPGEPKIYFC